MKKVIVLSAVLGLGAIGMACGESANNTNTAKPMNVNAAVNTANVAANTAMNAANQMSNAANQMANAANAMKPATNMSTNANMKPAMSPANTNMKK